MESIPHLPSKKVAGIYGIVHIATSRIYVGSAVNIVHRWNRHENALNANKHENRYLQQAWNKYGPDAFKWIIIEEVVDRKQLIPTEQKWIDFYQASKNHNGFNINPTAGSRLGAKETPEQRERKRKNHPRSPRPDVAKLTVDEVRAIKAKLMRGDSVSVLAEEYNVSIPNIKSIKQNKTWKHITDFKPLPGPPIRKNYPMGFHYFNSRVQR